MLVASYSLYCMSSFLIDCIDVNKMLNVFDIGIIVNASSHIVHLLSTIKRNNITMSSLFSRSVLTTPCPTKTT
jgi:hypothetical protein